MTAASVFGPPLPPGGTIGVVAAASPYDARSEILRGVEWWESQGYRVKLADGVFDRDDYVAGDPRRRASDLVAMFADEEVNVVQALQGGYGSAQTIPHIDFDVIAANPKPFVGYSDITALHVAIRQRTGLATVYGYGLVGVGDKDATPFTRNRLLQVLTGDGTGDVPRRWERRGSSRPTGPSCSSRTSRRLPTTSTDSSRSSRLPGSSIASREWSSGR
jgi:muramoyltetrapeptide carboxypeptidase